MDDSVVSDEALLARLLQFDQLALAELYDRHRRTAFSLAYRVVGNPETAEDVVQESFLTVWRRAERYQPEKGSARNWLLAVVRNRAIDAIRGPGAPARQPAPIDDLPLVAADDPEFEAMRAIEGQSVRAALDALPREQREVIELAYFGGLAYPEVAARTGAPLGTVKSRMRLALERLRVLVGPAGEGGER